MAGITVQDFSAYGSGIIDYLIDGEQQPTSSALHFELSDDESITFAGYYYPESFWIERYQIDGVYRTITFTSPVLDVVGNVSNSLVLTFIGNTVIRGDVVDNHSENGYKATIYCNGNLLLNTTYNSTQGITEIDISNGYLNVDNTTWTNSNQDIVFGSNAQLQITSSSNGKTLIKANEVSGTITLDVQSGVNEGNTFSIEATTNNLVITDGEWTATPSTVGNVTTYTLAKATSSAKTRILYDKTEGSNLPSGYTQVEYLESTGVQRIPTGIRCQDGDIFELKFQFTSMEEERYLVYGDLVIGILIGKLLVGYSTLARFITTDLSAIHTVRFDSNTKEIFLDGVYVNKIERSSLNDLEYLFNTDSLLGGQGGIGRIYYFKIIRNNNDLYSAVPCLDNNNVPCVYDLVSGNTSYNDGSGNFSYGDTVVTKKKKPRLLYTGNKLRFLKGV